MENYKENFCRLCLNFINKTTFTIIENVTKDILDFLLLKVNFEDISRSAMCNDCSEKLFSAFEFKSNCVDNDDLVMTYVEEEAKELPFDITEIYKKEMAKKGLTVKLEDNKICRLCLKLVPNEFVSVQGINGDLITGYIPGMDFDVTKDPIVCKQCFDSLNIHTTFLKNCLNSQSNIKNVIESEEIEDLHVEPLSVCIKSESLEIKPESDGEEDRDKMQPQVNCKQESLLYCLLKGEAIPKNYNLKSDNNDNPKNRINVRQNPWKSKLETLANIHKCHECDYQTKYKQHLSLHRRSHANASEKIYYKCTECDYQTRYKSPLLQHQLTHKDISEVEMYKCDKCDFQTKYRQNFARHRLKHADKSEVDTYKCTQCHYQTVHKRYLVNHLLNHKDGSEVKVYQCGMCDFQTKFKQRCANHELTHQGAEAKKFKCDECDYRATNKRYLDSHRRVHKDAAEMQTYKCEMCGFKTKYNRSIIRHRLKQHGHNNKVECNN